MAYLKYKNSDIVLLLGHIQQKVTSKCLTLLTPLAIVEVKRMVTFCY